MFSFQSGLLGVWQKKDCFCFSLTFSFSPFLAFFFPLSLSLFLVARQVRWVGWDFSGKFLVIMGFGGGKAVGDDDESVECFSRSLVLFPFAPWAMGGGK
jgi:hypothetical protein